MPPLFCTFNLDDTRGTMNTDLVRGSAYIRTALIVIGKYRLSMDDHRPAVRYAHLPFLGAHEYPLHGVWLGHPWASFGDVVRIGKPRAIQPSSRVQSDEHFSHNRNQSPCSNA